jgi:DNA modification methylase
MSAKIHEGDALEILRSMPDNSYHGCLTDPPYGLSFMGHGWDHGVPSVDVWREVLRVLRPGAHVLAFGGTRTFHRLTCAIEDAGFEIRDCMQWLYGSGFPKSHDVSKAIDREAGAVRPITGRAKGAASSHTASLGAFAPAYDATSAASAASAVWSGHGTALKPAWEPIIVARKPLDGTVAQNVQRWGCGGLAIDACRIGYASDDDKAAAAAAAAAQRACQDQNRGLRTRSNFAEGAGPSTIAPFIEKQELGRWPANIILDEEAGQALDAQSGNRPGMSGGGKHKPGSKGGMFGAIDCEHTARGDSGGASRFFYCPKASRAERDAGLDAFEPSSPAHGYATLPDQRMDREQIRNPPRNVHPTVKPIALARYLARLILPPIPDARMVTPFSGSGSEVIGALQAGWSHVDGIDSWDVAVRISRARIEHWSSK